MLDQLINLVKHFGQKSVVDNKDVPNEHNEAILADATQTIGGGFQNILAGGGFQNILDLFRKGKNSSGGGGGLLKSSIVSMMVGYFINKLMGKYNLSRSTASQVSNGLIPNVLGGLIDRTTSHAPENDKFDFNDLLGALTGQKVQTSESSPNGFNFQKLLDHFVGGGNGNETEINDVAEQIKNGTQEQQEEQKESGGFMNLIKGFFHSHA